MTQYQAIRGMNDILPAQIKTWQHLEAQLKALVESYGYQEIRFPIMESLGLFKRTIGEVTDIVEKEMYAFADRNGDNLALRPEGTAGCVRAAIEHGLLYNQQQKLWYLGPMFRHERPQKGRYRQFYQFAVEAFGYPGPDIDAEMLLMTARLWRNLGLENQVSLQINSLGSAAARAAYKQQLVQYYEQHLEQLDEDSRRRLYSNPLRILDSKNPLMQSININAPKLADCWDEESRTYFERLCLLLDAAGIQYEVNPCLVRGLDYYNGLVFEWVTSALGAQGTVCAGGRYNGLVEQLGGKPTTAIGFALGLERLVLLYEQVHPASAEDTADIFIITLDAASQTQGLLLAERLRNELPAHKVLFSLSEGSLKNQLKRADKSGASLALIMGEAEREQQAVIIKYLREEKPQEVVNLSVLTDVLKKGAI